MLDRFNDIDDKLADLEGRLADPSLIGNQQEYQRVVKEHSHLSRLSELIHSLRDVEQQIGDRMDVGVGVIDVKNYYVETPDDVLGRIERCLEYVPAEKLSVSPDCGLSQTARWASRRKLANMVEGARKARDSI